MRFNKIIARTLLAMCGFFFVFSASALVATPQEIVEGFDFTDHQSIVFASELNISNGNPYTRDFGERGMFGKLVHSFHAVQDMDTYIEHAEAIYAEALRLLLGPWESGGDTEMSFCNVGKGMLLDLDSGKWVRSNGGFAIKVRHTTEYMNKVRYAFILVDEKTLWRTE